MSFGGDYRSLELGTAQLELAAEVPSAIAANSEMPKTPIHDLALLTVGAKTGLTSSGQTAEVARNEQSDLYLVRFLRSYC